MSKKSKPEEKPKEKSSEGESKSKRLRGEAFLNFKDETKGTARYEEVTIDGEPVTNPITGTFYVRKKYLLAQGYKPKRWPKEIKLILKVES